MRQFISVALLLLTISIFGQVNNRSLKKIRGGYENTDAFARGIVNDIPDISEIVSFGHDGCDLVYLYFTSEGYLFDMLYYSLDENCAEDYQYYSPVYDGGVNVVTKIEYYSSPISYDVKRKLVETDVVLDDHFYFYFDDSSKITIDLHTTDDEYYYRYDIEDSNGGFQFQFVKIEKDEETCSH